MWVLCMSLLGGLGALWISLPVTNLLTISANGQILQFTQAHTTASSTFASFATSFVSFRGDDPELLPFFPGDLPLPLLV